MPVRIPSLSDPPSLQPFLRQLTSLDGVDGCLIELLGDGLAFWDDGQVCPKWQTSLIVCTQSITYLSIAHIDFLVTDREQQQSGMQVEAERRQESQNEHIMTAPSSAPPKSSAVLPSRGSPTPASRVAAASNGILSQSTSPQPTHAIRKNYDLFSRGYDAAQRARWMSNPLPSSTENSDPPQSPSQQVEESAAPDSAKRKRQPSPDVIPNPPGCSYGLNDDYFIYDDEDWAAQEREHPDATPTKSTTNASPEEKGRSSKRVRIERPANFNHQGHFETPGWSSSESSSSTRTTPLDPHATGASPRQATVESIEDDQQAIHNGKARQATIESVEHGHKSSPHGIAKKNGLGGSNDRRLLKKARDQAEQYKPKTPSRLRSAHRFSGGSDSGVSDFQGELKYNSEDAIRRRRMRKTSLAKACPTGDLRHIIWPEFDTWANRLSCFINEDVVKWVHTMPERQDERMLRDRQNAFNIRFLEELDKKRADPNYIPRMWDCPK
jgi:hypothetical protein